MKNTACLFLFALFASTLTFAGNTNIEVGAIAENAILMRNHGQTNEADAAFQQFVEAWKNIEKEERDNLRRYDKQIAIKAAECFLVFGQSSNALAVITQVLKKTGRSLPPESLYIYLKSTFSIGDYQATIKHFDKLKSELQKLSIDKRQELALIGASAASKLGDKVRSKAFLNDAVLLAPDTLNGKNAQQELNVLEK